MAALYAPAGGSAAMAGNHPCGSRSTSGPADHGEAMLAQLPEGFTALVTGAGGGIGAAVVEALLASPRPGRVIAVGRHPPAFEDARHQPLRSEERRVGKSEEQD